MEKRSGAQPASTAAAVAAPRRSARRPTATRRARRSGEYSEAGRLAHVIPCRRACPFFRTMLLFTISVIVSPFSRNRRGPCSQTIAHRPAAGGRAGPARPRRPRDVRPDDRGADAEQRQREASTAAAVRPGPRPRRDQPEPAGHESGRQGQAGNHRRDAENSGLFLARLGGPLQQRFRDLEMGLVGPVVHDDDELGLGPLRQRRRREVSTGRRRCREQQRQREKRRKDSFHGKNLRGEIRASASYSRRTTGRGRF